MSTELEALLDSGDEERIAAAMRDDPAVAEAVQLQRAIDASLRRAFVMPDLEGLHQRIEEAAEISAAVSPAPRVEPRPAGVRSALWTVMVAAAAIVVTVMLGKWRLDQTRSEAIGPVAVSEPVLTSPSPASEPSPGALTVSSRWVDLYRGLPPQGFGSVVVPPDLDVFGSEDGVSCAADGSSALSIDPGSPITIRSECGNAPRCEEWGIKASRILELTVQPQGMRVLVFVYRGLDDPRPSAPANSRFHLHRRQLGHLVLYELSPLRRAVALPALSM